MPGTVEAWRGQVVRAAERMGLLPAGAGPVLPVDEWGEAAVRASYQETRRMAAEEMFLGVRVEVSRDAGSPWRWPGETVEGDNVAQELVEMVKRGDEAGFRALAGCVMPAGEVDECWCGARARLGLQS